MHIIIKCGLIIVYIFFILAKTIIGRPLQPEPIFKPLFWEIQNGYWQDIAFNIMLFIPFGFLVGGCKGALVGICLSLGIEIAQYAFHIGMCELDDVLNNSVGTVIGVLLNKAIVFLVKKMYGET